MPRLHRQRRYAAANSIIDVLDTQTVPHNGVVLTAQSSATYGIRYDPATLTFAYERRTGQQRAEMVAPRMTIGGAGQRYIWDFKIDQNAENGIWGEFGQIHGLNDVNGRSSPIGIFPEDGRLNLRTRDTDAGGTVQASTLDDMGPIILGQWYTADLSYRQHATAGVSIFKFGLYGGAMTTWRNITTGRVGFPDEESGQPAANGPYFKIGPYGDTANVTAVRCSARNLRITSL